MKCGVLLQGKCECKFPTGAFISRGEKGAPRFAGRGGEGVQNRGYRGNGEFLASPRTTTSRREAALKLIARVLRSMLTEAEKSATVAPQNLEGAATHMIDIECR